MMPGSQHPAARSIVHLVEDDEKARVATARLLTAAGFEVRTYASGDDFLARFDRGTTGCILLDMRLPDRTGLDLQAVIAEREAPLPIIFLTGHGEIRDTVQAIQRGAIDFLTKPVDGDLLLAAVTRAVERSKSDRDSRAHLQAIRDRYERLTPRERQVFAHLIGGQINKQVAADLNISERTIKLHRARIFEKLEVDSMAALVRLAIDLEIAPASLDS